MFQPEPKMFYAVSSIGPHQLVRGTPGSAGMDILAAEDKIIRAQSYEAIGTCLHVWIPRGYVGLVKSRSGNAFKLGIEVGAGVIDSDYRGEVKVLLHNMSDEAVHVERCMKIAQLIVVPCLMGEPEAVSWKSWKDFTNNENSERGSKGFGSTGGNIENV